MMDDLKVALFEYDLSQPFDQVWINRPRDAHETKEIRFSKKLWEHLMDGKDTIFNITVEVYSAISDIEQGLVGKCHGAELTTEWVLEHASRMTTLPGFIYLHLYIPNLTMVTTTPPTPTINLLHLAQQVTSP